MKTPFSLFILFLCSFSVLGQDYAIEQLENSPRHHEWIELQSSDRTMHNFVAYPERSDKAPVFIVIHENRGLNDWARSFTDQLASEGFIAIAPDLISNTVDGIDKTTDFETSDAARSAIYDLDPENVTQDLKAVLKYAQSIEAGNGEIYVIGFCWGGSQSFRFATNAGDKIKAAMVFYGTGPGEAEEYASIQVPVYGFYGKDDNRVNSTIEASKEAMNKYNKTYEYEIYTGAGHAFMRRGDDPNADEGDFNVEARNESWKRILKIVNEN